MGICSVSQSPDLKLSSSLKVFIFVAGVIECTLFGGAIFGWPQLVHILKGEGLFEDLCGPPTLALNAAVSNESMLEAIVVAPVSARYAESQIFNESAENLKEVITTCYKQDEMFTLVYTLSICFYGLPAILVGYILHHAGLLVSRISAGVMMTAGFLFLGIATKSSPNWLFPAMILLALGGNQSRMGVAQFGDLYPKYRSTAITLISGVYAVSASLFFLFQVAQWMDIPRPYVAYLFAVLSALTVLYSFWIPPHHIPVEDTATEAAAGGKKESLPLQKSIFSYSAVLMQFWIVASLFGINGFHQYYNVWVTKSTYSVAEAARYSTYFSYFNLLSVLTSPLGGLLTDYFICKAKKTAKDEIEFKVREVQASFLPLLITSISVTGVYAGLLFYHTAAIYTSLICLVIARPSIMAVTSSYVRLRFPADHFNRMMGYFVTFTSAMMFLQYPHFKWTQNSYYIAHMFVILVILFSYANPLHLLITPLIRKTVIERDGLHEVLAMKSVEADKTMKMK